MRAPLTNDVIKLCIAIYRMNRLMTFDNIVKESNMPRSSVRSCMKYLEYFGVIEIKGLSKGRIVYKLNELSKPYIKNMRDDEGVRRRRRRTKRVPELRK